MYPNNTSQGRIMEEFSKYVDENRDRFLAELRDLCAQPSIAAQGIGLEETAGLIEQRLKALGAQVRCTCAPGGTGAALCDRR